MLLVVEMPLSGRLAVGPLTVYGTYHSTTPLQHVYKVACVAFYRDCEAESGSKHWSAPSEFKLGSLFITLEYSTSLRALCLQGATMLLQDVVQEFGPSHPIGSLVWFAMMAAKIIAEIGTHCALLPTQMILVR